MLTCDKSESSRIFSSKVMPLTFVEERSVKRVLVSTAPNIGIILNFILISLDGFFVLFSFIIVYCCCCWCTTEVIHLHFILDFFINCIKFYFISLFIVVVFVGFIFIFFYSEWFLLGDTHIKHYSSTDAVKMCVHCTMSRQFFVTYRRINSRVELLSCNDSDLLSLECAFSCISK